MISFNPAILVLEAPTDGEAHLVGSRCNNCGKVYFPGQDLCTECLREGTMETYYFGSKGEVYSYTIVERDSLAPPGFKAPYAYGYIAMPEGVRVLGKIIDWTAQTLRIGTPVEMTLEEIRRDKSNESVMGFRFRVLAA